MYAEITIHCSQPANFGKLLARFPSTPVPAVIAESTFADATEMAASVIHAHLNVSYLVMVFSSTPQQVAVHIENRGDTNSLSNLKDTAASFARDIRRSAERLGTPTDEICIKIYAEEEGAILKATQQGKCAYVVGKVADNLIGDGLTSLCVAILTMIFGGDFKGSGLIFIGTWLALIGRTCLAIGSYKGDFSYVDA